MFRKESCPPRPAVWFLKMAAGKRDSDYALGDLRETFEHIAATEGTVQARLWFWGEVLRSLPGFVRNYFRWRIDMLINSVKLMLRNLRRQKGYSLINIAGLSLGIALFILIMSYVTNELSYNSFHTRLDRIYQIGTGENNGTPVPMAVLLKQNFPEIEQAVRFRNNFHSQLFRYKGGFFKIEESYFVDPEIFDVFTFPLIRGHAETALKDPFSLVLSETEARRIFGNADPIGKTINYDNQKDFTVTAVIQDPPRNSSISFGALFSIEALDDVTDEDVSWGHWNCQTYLLLTKEHDPGAVEEKIRLFMHGIYSGRWGMSEDRIAKNYAFSLRPVKDLYFDAFRGGRYQHGSLQNVYIFTLVAFIVLVIACINFVNLTTARASIRAKEVGVRKVLGSRRSLLIKQFLGESVLLNIIATGLACLLVLLFMPLFRDLIGKELEFGLFSSPVHGLFLLAFALGLGLISGFYPAFVLTAFRPADSLSGKTSRGIKGAAFRKILTVFQFAMSIVLIIGTITVIRQLSFINDKDLGFNKDHLLWFEMSGRIGEKADVFRQKLEAYPGIEKYAASRFTRPGITGTWDLRTEETTVKCTVFLTDADFVDTIGLNIIQGRDFSREMASEAGQALILNQTAVRAFGLDSPIGETLSVGNSYTVVGVVEDFHFQSLHNEIEPLALVYDPPSCNIANIRISPHDVDNTLAYVGNVWKELSPDHPFEYYFFDESYDRLYRADEKFQALFVYFSLIAVFVACLGLLGLASYLARQRTKEIGIRKVMGATVANITLGLSGDFVRIVLVANVFAWPVAWIAMNLWLRNFAFRINMNLWVLLLAGSGALLLALVTVGYQAFKAASADPVNALRYE